MNGAQTGQSAVQGIISFIGAAVDATAAELRSVKIDLQSLKSAYGNMKADLNESINNLVEDGGAAQISIREQRQAILHWCTGVSIHG